MNVRQALKIKKKCGKVSYDYWQLLAARRLCKRNKHRLPVTSEVRVFDVVVINCDTGYDCEGVPVSVKPGSRGIVTDIDVGGLPQVLCYTYVGLEEIGVPRKHLEKFMR